jgi:hypothetical protein
MNQLPIDVDAEAIFLDGVWYTRDDLGRKIKTMIDKGDFNVARPSAALEALSATMLAVRTLSFRATAELGDALTQAATRTGNSVGQLIREAIMQFLSQDTVSQEVLRHEKAMKVIPGAPEATSEEGVKAGPGALRAAGVNAEQTATGVPTVSPVQPIELTRRVETTPQQGGQASPTVIVDTAENRWFKQ